MLRDALLFGTRVPTFLTLSGSGLVVLLLQFSLQRTYVPVGPTTLYLPAILQQPLHLVP